MTIENAEALQKKGTDKKFIVDVYTDWCGWCKVMDKKTFTDPSLIAFLNEHFHMVKFDAEQKTDISYKGKTYKFIQYGRSGVNELGSELLQNQLSYPSLVYLDNNLMPLLISPGFKSPEQLRSELENLL